jgi:hypothetical protein
MRRHAFLTEHPFQAQPDLGRPDALEVEPLQPAEHGRRRLGNFLGLGGGEDEDDARRRLLEHLQQGVPRLAREHVRLVHDVDLVPIVSGRRVHGPLPQVARVVHAPVRCGVDLHDVE